MFDSISSVPITSDFLYPVVPNRQRNKDVNMGGIWVNDTSEGLDYQGWLFFVEGGTIRCKPFNENRIHNIITVGNTEDIAGAFDRNMNPCVAYKVGDNCFFYYFDTVTLSYVTIPIQNCRSFGLTHDDTREFSSAISDVILTWVTNDNILYYAIQRERFQINHVIPTPEAIQSDDGVETFGMNTVNRLQWDIGNSRQRNDITYT